MITNITPGDILATRNTDEVGNDSPGWWNHLAILSVNGWVVEAQWKPDAVIAVPVGNFLERYPEILAFSVVSDADQLKVAEAAIIFVGLPYRRVASLFPRWRRPFLGENCVSVVRKTIIKATGRDPGWRRPDHAVNQAIRTIEHKIDYAGWVRPATWLAGMTTEPRDLAQAASSPA